MKVFIICSKRNYPLVADFVEVLKAAGHEPSIPNCIADPESENKAKAEGQRAHADFKQRMYKQSREHIETVDAVAVINPGGYIGGATFLEMFEAFSSGKKIYLQEPVTQEVFRDEVQGFEPLRMSELLI